MLGGRWQSWGRSRRCSGPVVARRKCPAQALGWGGAAAGCDSVRQRDSTFVLLLCLCFLGASEAFSLAECESGLLQYGSAL